MELTPDAIAFEPRFAASPPAAPALPGAAARPHSLRTTLSLVTLAWMFGSVWSTTSTGEPLTLFAQKLGASNFQFGLLTALPFLASLFSLPGSLLIEWTGRRKRVFLTSMYIQRALWFVIALWPLWLVTHHGLAASGRALNVFLWLMFVMYAAGAAGGPAWLGWMADRVPSRVNGKYFSRRRQWGILTAVPAAIFVGWFLDHRVPSDAMSVLRWCGLLFLCCAVCGLTDIHLFEYVPAAPRPPRKAAQLLSALWEPMRNPRFLWCSAFVGMLTFAVNFLGQFATLYLMEQVGMANIGVQMVLVVSPMIAQLLVLSLWGRAADRMGKRPLLVLASIGLVPVGIAWCFVTPSTIWLAYLLSGLGAALWTGVEVANLNLVLEASAGQGAAKGGSSYAAINNVLVSIAGCMGGLAAGVIAQLLSNWHWQPLAGWKTFSFYDVLFVASGFLRLMAVLIFLPLIHDPLARPTRQAARFMMTGAGALLIAPVQSIRRFTWQCNR